jgi:hypothetical protein
MERHGEPMTYRQALVCQQFKKKRVLYNTWSTPNLADAPMDLYPCSASQKNNSTILLASLFTTWTKQTEVIH